MTFERSLMKLLNYFFFGRL